jgi:succinyl-CoA synthetase beta subunit
VKLHEYQSKRLFAQYGIPIPQGQVATTPDEARTIAEKLGRRVVVKSQVLVGGRGKAGGVKVAKQLSQVEGLAAGILGLTIKGEKVARVMVSPAADIRKEHYVGLVLDRQARAVTLMLTAEGGVDIEDLAASRPEAILKVRLVPHAGYDRKAVAAAVSRVFPQESLAAQANDTIERLYRLFVEKDCSLVEINPYALVDGERLVALDAKINFDDNALYKHEDIAALANPEELSADESRAREVGLSFVSMDGTIGCIVNGAGLAMATMDMIKLFGAEPANFLDVGGSSNPAKVLNALNIILSNPRVEAILINIFGGITRCDDIANGILMARKQTDIRVPLIIRLIGTNDAHGREILKKAGLSAFETMTDAVKRVVAAAAAAREASR